jgi:chloramphenicol 3-O-phosphotransferase
MRKSTLFVLSTIVSIHCFGMEREEPPKKKRASAGLLSRPCVFLLNGPTTSGKSSIAAELEKRLECGKQYSSLKKIALDDFFGSHIPLSFLWSITPAEMDEARKKSHSDLCLAAKAAYDQKLDVIIDTVVYKEEDFSLYKKAFAGCLVKWILVYCPVETLVQRIIQRNEKSGVTEQRSALQALDQFSHFYTNKYMNPIDTLSPHTLVSTCTTARKQHPIMQEKNWWFINNIQNAICPSDLSAIQKSLLENLTPNGIETGIGPVEPHDYVVNTALKDSAACADDIVAFFQ